MEVKGRGKYFKKVTKVIGKKASQEEKMISNDAEK